MPGFEMFLNKNLSSAEFPLGLWHTSHVSNKVHSMLKDGQADEGINRGCLEGRPIRAQAKEENCQCCVPGTTRAQ